MMAELDFEALELEPDEGGLVYTHDRFYAPRPNGVAEELELREWPRRPTWCAPGCLWKRAAPGAE